MINKINPSSALFIKLGNKGIWEKECIESGTLRIGFDEFTHEYLMQGNTDGIKKAYQGKKVSKGIITLFQNQISNFYNPDINVLWITFYNQKLWWCFADNIFKGKGNDVKLRYVIDQWCSTDIYGKELHVDNLSGQLLKTQGYQSTICKVDAFDYLVNKINGEELIEVKQVKADMVSLQSSVALLIQKLHPKDFEVFVDLIFRQTGYLRTNVIGSSQKTKDIELLSPVTNERILVQIKTASSLHEYMDYDGEFEGMKEGYDRFFYVVHTSDKKLGEYKPSNSKINIWNIAKISELTINAGLTSWLVEKVN